MEINLRKTEKYHIFNISGTLGIDESEEIENMIFDRLDPDAKMAILDLGSITYITSPVLGAFVRIQRTLKSKGTQFAIITSSSELINLFNITGTAQFFTVFPSEETVVIS